MENSSDKFRKFLLFILASLLLHFGLGFFFYKIHTPRPTILETPAQEVVFVRPEDILTPAQLPNARGLELADIAKPKVEKIPKQARFKSQYNSAVEDETVARKLPQKARADVDVSEESGSRPPPAEQPKETKEKPMKVASRPPLPEKTPEAAKPPEDLLPDEGEKKVSLSDLELKTSDFKDIMKDVTGAPKETKTSPQKTPDLFASKHPFRPGPVGGGDRFVHDFLPGVKIGDKTYLNTLAFPDVQYFVQLKRVFRLRFNPAPSLIGHFQSNRVVMGKVNVTMAMEVSPSGQLQKIFVIQSSGIPGYDREALTTVRESAPFSSPPQKILDKDGMLRMTWHFTTYL